MKGDLKFIHCSDLHLGSRFVGISDTDPALGKRLTDSVFESFRRIVDLAISENVDLVVISGDVFDEENESPSARHRFVSELSRLSVPVFISLGNHDHKRSWESSIPYPENVHIFSAEPETIELDIRGNTAEITGRSFSSRHTSENLAASLEGSPDVFTIGVVHCSLDSTSNDDRYAPCKLSDLLGKNIDYWALGHIHKRSVTYERPHVVYPGNIQGRNTKESGSKGAYLVTVRNGYVEDLRFVPTQSIIWQDVFLDITGKNYGSLIDDICSASEKGSVLSLHIKGRGELDKALRLHADEFLKDVSKKAECIISSMETDTYPDIDLSSLGSNDLFSKIIGASDALEERSREDIIDTICSTRLSSDIRPIFENMSDEELISLIRDARMLLIDMLSEDLQ